MRDRKSNLLKIGDQVFTCRNLHYGLVAGFRYGNGSDRPDQVIIDTGASMPGGIQVLQSIEPWEVELIQVEAECRSRIK